MKQEIQSGLKNSRVALSVFVLSGGLLGLYAKSASSRTERVAALGAFVIGSGVQAAVNFIDGAAVCRIETGDFPSSSFFDWVACSVEKITMLAVMIIHPAFILPVCLYYFRYQIVPFLAFWSGRFNGYSKASFQFYSDNELSLRLRLASMSKGSRDGFFLGVDLNWALNMGDDSFAEKVLRSHISKRGDEVRKKAFELCEIAQRKNLDRCLCELIEHAIYFSKEKKKVIFPFSEKQVEEICLCDFFQRSRTVLLRILLTGNLKVDGGYASYELDSHWREKRRTTLLFINSRWPFVFNVQTLYDALTVGTSDAISKGYTGFELVIETSGTEFLPLGYQHDGFPVSMKISTNNNLYSSVVKIQPEGNTAEYMALVLAKMMMHLAKKYQAERFEKRWWNCAVKLIKDCKLKQVIVPKLVEYANDIGDDYKGLEAEKNFITVMGGYVIPIIRIVNENSEASSEKIEASSDKPEASSDGLEPKKTQEDLFQTVREWKKIEINKALSAEFIKCEERVSVKEILEDRRNSSKIDRTKEDWTRGKEITENEKEKKGIIERFASMVSPIFAISDAEKVQTKKPGEVAIEVYEKDYLQFEPKRDDRNSIEGMNIDEYYEYFGMELEKVEE